MTVGIKELLSKINKLEREIKSIESAAKDVGITKLASRKKELLNYSCVKTEIIEFDSLSLTAGNNMLVECELEFVAAAVQEVEISIVISQLVIVKSKQRAVIGINKFSLAQEFLALESKQDNIYVYITPLDGKQILLSSCQMNIWGGESKEESKKCNVIELDDKFLLSFIKNNIIYYKIITKQTEMFAEIDFEFCAYAKDYSFAYLKSKKELYLFRIDENFNLIIDNLTTGEMFYIDNQVTNISAAFSEEKIVAAYIKNNIFYVLEIENKNAIFKSEIGYKSIIKNVVVFYNKFSQDFCFVLSLFSGRNIMIKQQKEVDNFGEHLKLGYDIYAIGYEVKNGS